MFGMKGDDADEALVGPAIETDPGPAPFGNVSRRVMANPLGTFPEPLDFLFFELGPVVLVGEPCLEWFRGVIVADVLCDEIEDDTPPVG